MRYFYTFFIFLFSGLITFSQTYNPDVENIIDEVNQNSLIYFLRNLSGEDPVMVNGEQTYIEHRVSNWGNELAADYLMETLEGFGLEPVKQVYSDGGSNVYAVQEGTVYPEEYYMICAHYDAVDYYCADDNASGSTGVLEAARIFSNLEFEYSIIYALWDEEEIGLIGSAHYASQAASNGDVIHAVINMDMISWDGDDDSTVEIHSSYDASSNVLSDYIVDIIGLYNIPLTPAVQIPGTTASDHSRFWVNDYAAVLVIEEYYGGDFNPYYHTEEDRIAILHMPYFHKMAQLSIGSLASLASPIPDVGTSIAEMGQFNQVQISNYPNPFNRETNIIFMLEEESHIRISLVNSLGMEIRVLMNDIKSQGNHQLKLNMGDQPEGMYFLSVQAQKGTFTHKMLVH